MKKTLKDRLAKLETHSRAFAKRVVPRPYDDEKTRLFKLVAWSLIGMLFVVVFFSVSVFFLVLRGQEQTMVPRLVGSELTDAMTQLQEKELVPYLQLKFSDNPKEKGTVVSQDPEGGIVTKAGRRVTLWVSKGAVMDNVGNFVGQNIADVQLRLRTLFSDQQTPLLKLADTPVYVFNSAPEGTVLEQKPVPGTPLATPTELVVVVSKGPKGQTVPVAKYTGKIWSEAVAQLISEAKPFLIQVQAPESGQVPGTIISQTPASGSEMPKGTPVTLTLAKPKNPGDGRIFQVVATTLPDYPIPVDVKVELQKATGDRTALYSLKHPGGQMTIPVVADPDDVMIISVLDREVFSHKVGE